MDCHASDVSLRHRPATMAPKANLSECRLHSTRLAAKPTIRRNLPVGFKHRLGRLIVAVVLFVVSIVSGADLPFTFTKVGAEYRLTLQPSPAFYYSLQHTGDLLQIFDTIALSLGDSGATFAYTPLPGETRAFLRAEGISVSSPEDQDNDLIDDLWELQHASFNEQPYLDPFNPNDAFLPSPEPDAGGRNNLDYYFFRRGTVRLREVFTREVSVFNFGSSTAGVEAISRAVSIFNGESAPTGGIAEVYSRETTTFNFGSNPALVEAVSRAVSVFNGESFPGGDNVRESFSRETSVYNFGANPAGVEAVSRAVSVFNGESAPGGNGIAEVYSRETSVYNFGANPATVEAISRAVSVFNGETIPGGNSIPEVYSRETTIFNFGSNPATVEAISRAVSVLNTEP